MRKVFTNFIVSAIMLLSLSIVSFTTQATHISGADFNYQCVGQDSFWVTLNLFRDCTGINAPNRASVDFFSSCGQSFNVRLNKQNGANGTEISQLCPGSLNQSTCNGGPMPGMQQHIYAGLVVLSPKCDFWTMQWSLCCRNTTVNLVGQPEMMVEATMYSQTDSCNTSPVFNAQPILYVCLNQNVDYNFAVTEADGDSFVYEFVEPLDQMVGGVAQAVPFAAGYTYTQPIAGITLNTATGQLQFTPTIQGNFVLAVRVCEYDYQTGALLGCIIRDIQFVVIPCANQAPQPPVNGISSFTGTGSLISNDSVLACVGNSFSFDIVFTDADIADSVVLTTNITQVIPGATAVITNGNPATVTVSGVATAAMPIINTFIVNANDGACPIPATATAAYNIIVQPLPIVDAGVDQIVCKDEVPINITGTVQFATGGTWSGNGTFGSAVSNLTNTYTPTAAELASGNAELILTSTGNLNCNPVSDTVNIQLVSFDAGIVTNTQDVSCNSGNDGQAWVSLTGGTQPIQVVWNTNPVQNGDTATNLGAGTYNVTLVDGNGCDTVLSVIVAEPLALVTSITSQVNVACTGGNDGTATVQATGGVAPYTYLWSTSAQSQTTATASNLFAGSHSVTVTDANGCTAIQVVNVTQPNYPISVTVNTTDVTCFGDLDGSATATPSGGTAPYAFTWGPNGQTINPLTNIAGGTYSVTVVDNSGLCVVQTGIIVNEPLAISGTNNSSDVLCNGDATGVASFTPSGGTTPFTYQWGAGAGNAVTPNVTNLVAGTYSITLTDANNCLFDTTVIVDEPNALLVTTTDTMITCNGGGDGTSTVQVTGGVTPYSTSWNTAPVQTGFTATNLTPGNYTATVIDSNGCVENAAVVITEPVALTGTLVSSTNVSCTGGFNGEATVSGVGGTTPYTYLWGASAGNQTTANVDSLFAGTYPVTITDANGCTFVQSVTLTEPVSALSVALSVTDITCYGLTDGTATALATGGTAPYIYDWAPSNQTTATITGLPVSNNTVTVTDNSGDCIVETGILIAQPDPISSNGFTNDVICNGENSGYASVTGAGGTRPFTYLWDANANNQTDSFALNLLAGTYAFSITDGNGCLYDSVLSVDQPEPLSISNLPTLPLCYGGTDGSLDVSPNGGISPYTYAWGAQAANQTTSLASSLSFGAYSITITDSNACTVDSVFQLSQPTPVSTSLIVLNPVACFGDSTGSADIVGAGGTTPYYYQWNTSSQLEESGNVFGMAAGTYTVTVTDTNGCQFDTTLIITQPSAPLSTTSTVLNVACFGDSTAQITAIGAGGTSPYTYVWDSLANLQTTATATGLAIGSYEVWVTDSNGCQDSLISTVTQPQYPLMVSSTSSDVLCFGESTGSATATGFGGTAPYTFTWDNNANNQNSIQATNLSIGTYAVTVTDSLGCVSDTLVEVFEPAILDLSGAIISNVNCFGGSDAAIGVTSQGGILPYSYQWSASAFNQTSDSAIGLPAGSHHVVVTDSNGCVADSIIAVTEPTMALGIDTNHIPVSCNGGTDGVAIAIPFGGTAPYSYYWNGILNPGSDSLFNLNIGAYSVIVEDTNGCLDTVIVQITEPTVLSLNEVANSPVQCYGGLDGNATVTGLGGVAPYQYQWPFSANYQTDTTALNLGMGSYIVTVTDTNGCMAQTTVNISQPLAPLSNGLSSQSPLCNGDTNGFAITSTSGGTLPYQYAWSTGQIGGSDSLPNLGIGTYMLTITDSNGCLFHDTVSISEPAVLSFSSLSSQSVLCYGGNTGSAAVTVNGGTTPYQYQWGITTGSQTTAQAMNLLTGIHSIQVTDNNGCQIDSVVQVSQPSMALQIDTSHVPVSCFGDATGIAIASGQGGTSPYLYYWNGLSTASSDSLQNLYVGTYSVVVEDSNGCLDTASIQVTEPTLLTVNETMNNPVLCYGDTSGNATVLASGGVSPYSYQWPLSAMSQTDTTAWNLTRGAYVITVTDTNGCIAQTTVNISQPQAPLANSLTSQSPLCNGDTNGVVTTVSQGGTSPYIYAWSTGQVGANTSIQNVGAGTYMVTLTDTNGCILEDTILVTEPNTLLFSSVTSQSVLCYGGNTGSASVSVTGGTLPYQYGWGGSTGSQSTPQAINLQTGTHTIQITDANGCMVDSIILVDQPSDSIAISSIQNDVNCYSGSDGSITLTITGGTIPYTSIWSPNAINTTVNTASNLATGTYTTTITDANGCMEDITVVVNQPNAPISIQGSSTAVTCYGFQDGTTNMLVNGGSGPYNYSWDAATGNQTGASASNLVAGVYNGYVMDNNGCEDTVQITVLEPQPIVLQVSPDDTVCTQSNFDVEAQVFGGNGNYVYNWNNGLGNFNYHTTSTSNTNNYIVSVTDGLGCPGAVDTISITVFNIQQDSLLVWRDRDVCEGETAYLFADYNSNFGSFTYQWSHGLGSGVGPIPVTPIQSTIYQVTVTDVCNSSLTDFVVVNVLQTPIVNVPAIVDDGCGPLVVTFEDLVNDSGDFTYFWDFGDGVTSSLETPTHTFSQAGTYPISVTKTSSQGCTGQNSGSSVVTVFPTPVAYGEPNTFITDITSPTIQFTDMSTGANSFRWDFSSIDFATTPNASYTYPDTGTYPVLLSVSNQFGCESDYSFEVQVVNTGQINVPNAFTPDGGGGNGGAYDAMSLSNDVFYPRMGAVRSFNMTIFNRWGEMVFESKDVSIGWDGYYRDQIQAQDVYVWKIEAVFENGEQVSKVGSLTLLR